MEEEVMKLWIARFENGNLMAFYREPFKDANGFHIRSRYDYDESISWYSYNTGGEYLKLDPDLFPEITFENSPQMVELKLANEN